MLYQKIIYIMNVFIFDINIVQMKFKPLILFFYLDTYWLHY